jgi:hypothetical protein
MAGMFLLGSGGTVFNAGRSQIGFSIYGALAGDYPFANLMKNANISLSPALTPTEADANGWPLTRASVWVVAMPPQNSRAGSYYLRWTGTGVASFTIGGGMTLNSGSLTPSGGVGFAEVTPNTPTAGATANGFNISFSAGAQNIRFCHNQDDETVAMNPNAFHPKFLSVLRQLNCGVLRFMNWSGGAGDRQTTWASRTPTTYGYFAGAPLVAANYGGTSSASGSDLSVSTPSGGFSVTDKQRLQFFLSATPPSGGTGTFTNASTDIVLTAHGLAVGNQVYLRGGSIPSGFTGSASDIPNPTTYFVVNVPDANTIRISATSGGSPIASGANGSCTVYPFLTISVGGGAKTPIFNYNCYPYPQGFLNYPTGNTASAVRDMVYDATFGAFIDFGSTAGSACVPPELCLDLCEQVGAHPWFCTPMLAADPATDYLTGLATLCKTYQDTTAPWMVPRFETPNECWNTTGGFVSTQYAFRKAFYYGWTGNPSGCYNWIGKIGSICGQQLAGVYGGGNLGTSYHWIIGMPTVGGLGGSTDRIASTLFLSSDPNPVQSGYSRYATAGGGGSSPQNWASHLAMANYFSPLERFQCQELIDAYSYSVTNAGDAVAQAALANGYVDTLVSQQATVTVTNGSPNITWTSHGLSVNNQVVFLTTPPTGFTIGNTYYVKTVPDANTLTLAATQGGTTITPSASGSPTLAYSGAFNLARLYSYATQWKALADTYGVGMTFYEGGYSPDYLSGNWTTGITGATQAASCVLTLASTSGNSEASGFTGNPAVVGMSVTPSGIVGMTQLNGNTYTVTNVSGNQVTIDVNSTGFTAYSSGGTLTYVNSATYTNALRGAGKSASNLQTYLALHYANMTAAGGTFPSCYELSAFPPPPGSNIWSILQDIYQPFSTSSQARAIQDYND